MISASKEDARVHRRVTRKMQRAVSTLVRDCADTRAAGARLVRRAKYALAIQPAAHSEDSETRPLTFNLLIWTYFFQPSLKTTKLFFLLR